MDQDNYIFEFRDQDNYIYVLNRMFRIIILSTFKLFLYESTGVSFKRENLVNFKIRFNF